MVKRKDNFVPQAAMIIYESVVRDEMRTQEKIYVEVHKIDDKGTILSGQPLSEEAASDLAQKLYKSSQKLVRGFIPDTLLYLDWQNDKPVAVWWTPEQKVEAFYAENLQIPDGEINVPALVWKWNQSELTLSIYALENNSCPGPKTELYFAPFHNVYSRGAVCLGSGGRKLFKKNDSFISIVNNAQTVFWRTKFSEIHNDKAIDGNLNTLHHSLVTTGKPFPYEVLKSTKLTLQSICK